MIDVEKISKSLIPFLGLNCIGGKIYLGTMFYLDFGKYIQEYTTKGAAIDVGEMTLSVRDTEWWIKMNGNTVLSSREADRVDFSEVVKMLIGQTIKAIKKLNDQMISITFSNSYEIIIDMSNPLGTDGDLFELSLPDGQAIIGSHIGTIEWSSSARAR